MPYTIYMSEYNGWKNETTWTINVFYMEAFEDMVKGGGSFEDMKWYVENELRKGLSRQQRNVMGCALKLVDWDTLIARATENVEKEKVA